MMTLTQTQHEMSPDAEGPRVANWRPGQPALYESLWSVLHKFCWLNRVNGRAVMRHYRSATDRATTFRFKGDEGPSGFVHDLRFRGALDLEAFSGAIGTSASWCDYAVFDGVGPRRLLRRALATFLRFCPTCIASGFHSPIFQSVGERHCPIHGDLLRDCCPRCGRRIPYSLPTTKFQPYGCSCGANLWWGIGAETWKPAFESESQVQMLRKCVMECFGDGYVQRTHRRSGLLWYQKGGYTLEYWDSLFCAKGKRTAQQRTHVSRIWRSWGSDFVVQKRRDVPNNSVYGVVPDDEEFRRQLFDIFRRIERSIIRGFPASRRKRWLAMTRRVRFFDEIGRMPWSRRFLAYVIWKAYWFDSCFASFSRGHQMERESKWPYVPDLNKVYWRFLQHTRLLSPAGTFTSADRWAQLHFFSIVAMETFRQAERLAHRSQIGIYPFTTHYRARLEGTKLPLVVLQHAAATPRRFEFQVWEKVR